MSYHTPPAAMLSNERSTMNKPFLDPRYLSQPVARKTCHTHFGRRARDAPPSNFREASVPSSCSQHHRMAIIFERTLGSWLRRLFPHYNVTWKTI